MERLRSEAVEMAAPLGQQPASSRLTWVACGSVVIGRKPREFGNRSL
jgi:hypothetical protein